jgi:PTS system mannose-specific IIA component
MIGLVLVSHGNLGEAFVEVLEHVVGPQEKISVIGIDPDDDMEQRRADIVAAVKGVDSGQGVIVLTDMFGGTPSNLAISIMDEQKVEVLAGVNLPLLIKLVSLRKQDDIALEEVVTRAQNAGRKYINVASLLLGEEK